MLELDDIADDTAESIPAGLDSMPPGPELGLTLSSIDVGTVSGHDRIVVLRAHQRMISHHTAQLYTDMAAVVDAFDTCGGQSSTNWDAAEAAAAEIRAALTLTRRSADVELGVALELRSRLPQLHDMLACGELDMRRVWVILNAVGHLPDEAARSVIGRIAADAPRLTTGQLRARLRRLCIETDPDDATQRFEHAVVERRVVAEPIDSGTVNLLGLDLPPDRVTAVMQRVNRIAKSLRRDGETRTIDQLRADVYLDLLNDTAHHDAVSGVVDLRVDLDTLAGLNDHPGDLAGYGPVIADIARNVADHAPDAEWRFTVTDPDTGRPIHTDVSRRRPTASQRRNVEARNPACVFPGCRMPASDCDLDHRVRYTDQGPTVEDNLTPLCRHDHRIRHEAGWRHTMLPEGDHQWQSALGHTYTTSGTPP